MELNGRDKLDMLFEMQRALDSDIARLRSLDYTMEEWIQKDVLAMISELGELLDEVNFKWWKNKKELDHAAIKEELIDILHFYISMCCRAGMTPDELFGIYCAKNKENFDRQYGRSTKKGYEAAED